MIHQSICERCNKEFSYKRKSRSNWYHRRFCDDCKYIHVRGNHNSRKHFEKRYIQNDGYAYIWVDGKYVSEHRYVMEQMLARLLKKGENVHHKDGNRANNNPDNLELWLSPQIYGIRASDLICPHCGKSYSKA